MDTVTETKVTVAEINSLTGVTPDKADIIHFVRRQVKPWLQRRN